jgi:Fe-S-cluster containining protein
LKDCNQCGKCCILYGGGALIATFDEISQWELFEPDIFAYVHKNEIWVDPTTRVKLHTCPFLEMLPKLTPSEANKYVCGIYESRPQDCRQYPSLISEMIKDGCEMIELSDLKRPKQAQIALNYLK